MGALIFVKLIAILMLVVGNAYFVGSEIALTSARRSRVQHLAQKGDSSAQLVQLLQSEPERFYSVTQIGITLMSLGLGAIGISTITVVLRPLIDLGVLLLSNIVPSSSAYYAAKTSVQVAAFLFISALHIVGGELAPKVYAFHKPVRISLAVARPINLLYHMFSYIIWLLNHASNGLLRMMGQKDLVNPKGGHLSISEEELRTILVASESEGILDSEETAMIQSVFDLEEHAVAEIMVPRTKIVGLQKDITIQDFLEIYRHERHHRYPVYDADIDNIVGILSIKEILNRLSLDEGAREEDSPISEIMLPPYVAPATKSLRSLLADFRVQRRQMAIVIDEYGGTAGLVTLEDILEEIVGEYEDEFSDIPKYLKGRDKDGKLLVDPVIRLEDLEESIQFSFPDGEYKTLAGLIYKHLARVPEVGDTVKLPGCKIAVEAMDKHQIVRVSIEQIQDDQTKTSGTADALLKKK